MSRRRGAGYRSTSGLAASLPSNSRRFGSSDKHGGRDRESRSPTGRGGEYGRAGMPSMPRPSSSFGMAHTDPDRSPRHMRPRDALDERGDDDEPPARNPCVDWLNNWHRQTSERAKKLQESQEREWYHLNLENETYWVQVRAPPKPAPPRSIPENPSDTLGCRSTCARAGRGARARGEAAVAALAP